MLEGRYGVAKSFLIPVVKAGSDSFAVIGTDWTPVAGDVKISKDYGAFANITTLPTQLGNMCLFSLSATEMEAEIVTIQIIDAAVKDQAVIINNLPHGALSTGKLQGGSSTTAQLASVEAFGADNVPAGAVLDFHGGTGKGQAAVILSHVDATDTSTLDRTLTTAVGAATYYTRWPAPAAPSNPTAYAAVNVAYWNGTAVATPDTAGYPKVTIKSGTGTGEISLSSGLVSLSTRVVIKKNVAYNNFVFVATDSTNHNPVTGRTFSFTRSIDGAAFAAGTISGIAEIGNGFYKLNLAAADTNGEIIALRGTATGADDVMIIIHTQA